jgi:hypothetical protein
VNISPKVWPIGITLSIIAVAGLCIWTVKFAMQFPIEEDNTYFASYRDTDLGMNEIILKQRAFDTKYMVKLQKKDFIIGNNSIEIEVVDLKNSPVDGAKADLIITRPHTTASDKELKSISNNNGIYKFDPFEIKDLGRWQIQSRVQIDNAVSFNKLEVNATN